MQTAGSRHACDGSEDMMRTPCCPLATALRREQTGVVIELRLTVLGLTAHTDDAICSRARTIFWQELGESNDLLRLVADAIDHACGRRVTVLHPIPTTQERMAA